MTACDDTGPWFECRQCSYSTNTPKHADQHETDTGHIVIEAWPEDMENW